MYLLFLFVWDCFHIKIQTLFFFWIGFFQGVYTSEFKIYDDNMSWVILKIVSSVRVEISAPIIAIGLKMKQSVWNNINRPKQ